MRDWISTGLSILNPKEVSSFAEFLVRGVEDNKDEIDSIIINAASNWSLKRINPVDRGILREAIFEFIFCGIFLTKLL